MHDKWQEQIPYYVTGRLAATERDALEVHLHGCTTCRRQVDEWALIASMVQSEARGRASRLPPLDHTRYLPNIRSLPALQPLASSEKKIAMGLTTAANGSQPTQDPLPRERKKDMAISSLPVAPARGNARAKPQSGNALALLLVGIFVITLCVGFGNLNMSKFPSPGSAPGLGVGLQNITETPTPTGTEFPATRTPRPTIAPPTFNPSLTPPTRLPTIIPPTFQPTGTRQCINLIVMPGFEQFFERLANFLREQGFCVVLVYPTPRPTVTPGPSSTRPPTHVPPTFPPTPTRPPTIVPPTFPPQTFTPMPTRPPTHVPPTFPPPPTRPPTHVPPTQPPFPTQPPTHVPPTFPPPPTQPPFPTHPPFPTQPPFPTFPPPPTQPHP